MKWKDWCRLCARCDSFSRNVILNNSIIEMITKYLNITIENQHENINMEIPYSICENCYDFLLKFKQFNDHCLRSNFMFNEIFSGNFDKNSIQNDFDIINLKRFFNLLDNEEIFINFINKIDQSTDTDDLLLIMEEDKTELEFDNIKLMEETTNLIIDDIKLEETEINNKSIEKCDDELDFFKVKVEEKTKLIKCEMCDKTFTRSKAYNLHIKKKHKVSINLPYVCSKCPKRFSTETYVKIHEKTHLPDEEKLIHPCPFCSKKFSVANYVKTHIKTTHSNERSFMCDECGKGFKTKQSLIVHQSSHTEERPFMCSECPKRFKSNLRLKIHLDVHSETTYPCKICGTIFKTKKSIQSHMIVHSNEKRYKCQYCDNRYKRLKDLKCHYFSHTGDRPHNCPFCEKTFANSSNCRTHQKGAHPDQFAIAEANRIAAKDPQI